MSVFRDAVEAEGNRRTASILLPNQTIAATGDWDLSAALPVHAIAAWAEYRSE